MAEKNIVVTPGIPMGSASAGRYLGPHIHTGANSYLLAPIPITAQRLTPLSNLGRVTPGINDEYRRGTSLGSDKLQPLTPFIWDDFVGEHRYKKTVIDGEYTNVFKTLVERTQNEIVKKKELAKQGQTLTPINAAQKDLETTVKVIEEKMTEYDSKTKDAHSLYGLNPLYLMIDLPFRKIYEGVHQGGNGFNQALVAIDVAYKAALEQKRLSLEANILADQLPALAQKVDQLENASPDDPQRVASWASNRLLVTNVEKNTRLGLLAYFLQDAIVKATGPVDGLTRSQALEKYLLAIDSRAAAEKSAIGAFAQANSNIKSPLSKPELEALHKLVELQNTTELGKRWLDYHTSLLHSEAARQLTEISTAFKGMVARAKEAEAKQTAEEKKEAYLTATAFVAAANERALKQYGQKLSGIAKGLQANIAGKNIRSYTDAMASFEKVTANPKAKLNAQDRQAVVSALNALDKAVLADNISRMGKAFGVVGKIVQAEAIRVKTVHGYQTGDWKPLMLELEAMALGIGAGAALAVILGLVIPITVSTTIGIVAVSILIALVASLINAESVGEINSFLLK